MSTPSAKSTFEDRFRITDNQNYPIVFFVRCGVVNDQVQLLIHRETKFNASIFESLRMVTPTQFSAFALCGFPLVAYVQRTCCLCHEKHTWAIQVHWTGVDWQKLK